MKTIQQILNDVSSSNDYFQAFEGWIAFINDNPSLHDEFYELYQGILLDPSQRVELKDISIDILKKTKVIDMPIEILNKKELEDIPETLRIWVDFEGRYCTFYEVTDFHDTDYELAGMETYEAYAEELHK